MLIKLNSPKKLVDCISIISELVTEVKLKFLEEGLSLVAVDPANVAMIIFKMPKEAFSHYEANNEILGINLDDFKKILKRTSSASSVNFETEDNQLKISILDKSKRTFILSLIETTAEEKNEPNLDFSCIIEMDSSDFSQTVEDCFVVADSCALISKENQFSIEAKGSINSAKNEFSSDLISIKGDGRSKYSLEYLMKFIKANKISDKVIIKFSENYPLRLEFIGDQLGMAFILAPRVEND
jgi:proliferating cell nuclear antigen